MRNGPAGIVSNARGLRLTRLESNGMDSYTAEEIGCFRAVKSALLADGVAARRISDTMLVITTMCSKMRVEKAVAKFNECISVLDEYALDPQGGGYDEVCKRDWAELETFWSRYASCGVDRGGSAVLWIRGGGKTLPEEEQALVRTGFLAWAAVHSDLHTLRRGTTMVIDTTAASAEKVGNERKLQKVWQSYPLRPQNIFIVGAGLFKRVAITALIKFASLFTSNKVLSRIQFTADMEPVKQAIAFEQMPTYVSQVEREEMSVWVRRRLSEFPQLPGRWDEDDDGERAIGAA